MAALDRVLDRLEGVKRSGTQWKARCPCHDDKRASLSVALGRDDRVLIHCFAACPRDSIRRALGLAWSDFFEGSA